jgi:hypothetical protein
MRAGARILVASITVLGLVWGAIPAAASQVTDPNDVSGKLDLKVLAGTKTAKRAPLFIKIQTYGNWAKSVLKDSGDNRVYVLFDVDGDGKTDYTGEISESGGKLHMDISGSGSSFEPLPVKHPNGHTLKTAVPGDSPPNPKGTVWLAVRSAFKDTGSCATTCKDRLPDSAWLEVP